MSETPAHSFRDTLPCVIQHHDKAGVPTGKRYRIERKIDEGGFGEVYEGVDLTAPGQPAVAIKYLRVELCRDESAVKRFAKEAKIAMRVSSPYVVATRDYGRDQETLWFTVMEYVDSEATLADLVTDRLFQFTELGERQHSVSKKIDTSLLLVGELCTIVIQVCEGIEAVHGIGAIHRDVKPENVMIIKKPDGTRQIKLADFGISRFTEAPQDDKSLGATVTKEGMIVGSPRALAAEQIMTIPQVLPDGSIKEWDVCFQSDIYAIGVIVYLLVTGRYPFDLDFGEAEDRDIAWNRFCARVMHDAYPVAPFSTYVTPSFHELALLREFETYVIQKLLAKKPWNRPGSVRDVKEWFIDFHLRYARKVRELEGVTADLPEPAMEIQALSSSIRPPRRSLPPPAPHAPTEPVSETKRSENREPQPSRVIPVALLILALVGGFAVMGYFIWFSPAKHGSETETSSTDSAAAAPRVPEPASSSVSVHVPPTASQSAKRRAGDGPPKGSEEAKDFDRAVKSGNCDPAIDYSLLTLIKYPDYPEPLRVIAECNRKSGKVKDACDKYASYLAFEGASLSGDAEKFVAQKCMPSTK